MAGSISHSVARGFNRAAKRLFDLILLVPIIPVAAPIMLVSALAVWIIDGAPVLFRQERLGIHGKPFELLKFRTMRLCGDQPHRQYVKRWIGEGRPFKAGGQSPLYKIADDPRVTPLGAILRRFSIDELPQLINVLRGEMSLIGPRPALPYEVAMYKDWHRHRLDALPGLTGLWQVSGRNRLSFDEMVRLDIDYIDHWSMARDIAILARTPRAIIEGDGA